ncbi:hypothetical protein CAPTEDRAFT_217360 [Capitella teleta]|uniref:Uncharacterized protein n=1 Tax=Capitella teleta TaxID=283909 RepID=R7UZ00_CAPTE|nr:hypothetical protein CAPTEDRAFT_217360 [Capitella teleta]|eukprot:ELU09167.1 hypothetical protein CAPTEDRAFT_217360 [Capitella teleta]
MRMTSSQSPSPPSTLKKFDDIVSQRYKHQQPSVSTLTRRIGERSAAPPGATPGTPGTPRTPDPDLFSKYRFQFSSIGQLSRSGSQEDIVQESPRATFRFSDFDDMVARIREAEPVKEEDEKGREEGEGGDEEVGGGDSSHISVSFLLLTHKSFFLEEKDLLHQGLSSHYFIFWDFSFSTPDLFNLYEFIFV